MSVAAMPRRVATLVIAGAAGLALAACTDSAASVDLEGRTFTSTDVTGHELVEGSAITLAFEDGQVSARAGCNTLFGGATWDGGTLEITDQLASTMMACDDALMDQDDWLAEFLTSSPAVMLDEAGTLTLGDDDVVITLTED